MNNNFFGWQRCPVCENVVYQNGYVCSTCNGTKLISIATGKPPKSDRVEYTIPENAVTTVGRIEKF